VPDPTLYLFDGYNLLHAGGGGDGRELVDHLASFVAQQGARGIVVFDGHGQDVERGPLKVRYAKNADTLLERLAAENRDKQQVILVSSDIAVRGTSGVAVRKVSSSEFLRDLGSTEHQEQAPLRLGERLDEETRAKLEKLRRGQQD
jgi:predicted RNA-binding protein with PIN domain